MLLCEEYEDNVILFLRLLEKHEQAYSNVQTDLCSVTFANMSVFKECHFDTVTPNTDM